MDEGRSTGTATMTAPGQGSQPVAALRGAQLHGIHRSHQVADPPTGIEPLRTSRETYSGALR